MYDTEERIELVKKRMYEYHRRQERRTVCRLSVLCTLLFLSLVGAMGIMQNKPINVTGMYGTIQSRTGRWVRYRLNEMRPSQRTGGVESRSDTTLQVSATTTNIRHPHTAKGWATIPGSKPKPLWQTKTMPHRASGTATTSRIVSRPLSVSRFANATPSANMAM